MHFRCVLGLLGAAASGASAAVPQSPSFAVQFPGRVLAAHNLERVRAGASPLVWDASLGSGAANYAQQLAIAGRLAHSDRANRPGIGENLWMGTHGAFSIEAMVAAWASEKEYFTPGIFPNVSRSGSWEDVGHYTQMIWPSTRRIGCALASTPRIDYLVCRYAAAGNVDGQPIGQIVRR